MKKKPNENNVFQVRTIEFVTVATECCAFLEQTENKERAAFIDTSLKLLTLLYLKALLIPQTIENDSFIPLTTITQPQYESIRLNLAKLMGMHDDYLERCNDIQGYSEEIETRSVSEGLADIYQPLMNFLYAYRSEIPEQMQGALNELKKSFELYWGATLLSVLRALHHLQYESYQEDTL